MSQNQAVLNHSVFVDKEDHGERKTSWEAVVRKWQISGLTSFDLWEAQSCNESQLTTKQGITGESPVLKEIGAEGGGEEEEEEEEKEEEKKKKRREKKKKKRINNRARFK